MLMIFGWLTVIIFGLFVAVFKKSSKKHAIYNGVKGIESAIQRKDGIYYLTINVDYKNVDWKELHKRAPETHPDDNPPILKYSDVVPKLLDNGYVRQ